MMFFMTGMNDIWHALEVMDTTPMVRREIWSSKSGFRAQRRNIERQPQAEGVERLEALADGEQVRAVEILPGLRAPVAQGRRGVVDSVGQLRLAVGGRRVQARRHAFMVPGWPRSYAHAVCNLGLRFSLSS